MLPPLPRLPPTPQVTGGEAMYDQRLFNQDTGLGGPGMGAEDSYNIYDKPLFADRAELFKHKVGDLVQCCHWPRRGGRGLLVREPPAKTLVASRGERERWRVRQAWRDAPHHSRLTPLCRRPLPRSQSRQDDDVYAGGAGEEGDVNTNRFKPDKGFSGADYGKGGEGGAVQVCSDSDSDSDATETAIDGEAAWGGAFAAWMPGCRLSARCRWPIHCRA